MPDRIENGRLVFEDDEPADLTQEITLADALAALASVPPPKPARPKPPTKIPLTVTYDADLAPISMRRIAGDPELDLEHLRAHPEEYEVAAVYVEIC